MNRLKCKNCDVRSGGMEIGMEKRKKIRMYIERAILLAMLAVLSLMAMAITGCGREKTPLEENSGGSAGRAEAGPEKNGEEGAENAGKEERRGGLAYETAADGHIDFEALKEENPDIFAWLYVPGADIDLPILQSPVSDDYYKSHTADGREGEKGALYTEMPNLMSMCDFNTIIHGKDEGGDSLFSGLHRLEDPDFFEENEKFYIYLPDNVLTYEIFAAYYDEGSDILRRFDYTTYAGCEAFLEQVYASRDMGKNLREGWDGLTPYHFLVTLDGSLREEGQKQYVVLGVLIGDAAGKIDRVILD